MASPSLATSPVFGSLSGQSSRSRSSTKLVDDTACLTSYNPFSEEDENDQSSYALVTSLFSKVKNSLSGPLTSTTPTISLNAPVANNNPPQPNKDARRPSYTTIPTGSSGISARTTTDRPHPLIAAPAQAAPPMVSLTPAQSELSAYTIEVERPSSLRNPYSSVLEVGDGVPFGTSIPGFPIQDDARSVITTTSVQRSGSVSKIMRRLRGEGLSRDYWMDDENCKECYDCKSVFTTWRRKHHCRICGQIFCSRCASNILKGTRFNSDGTVRVCNLCITKLAAVDEDDDDDRRSVSSSVAFPAHQLGMIDSFNGFSHPQSPFPNSQLFNRTDEPFSLYPITENRHPFFNSSPNSSRPNSPFVNDMNSGDMPSVRDNPAPFRRNVVEEAQDSSVLGSSDDASALPRQTSRVEFPASKPITIEPTTSSIQFPALSPEHSGSPGGRSKLSFPTTPYAENEVSTPFIRSRVQSRLEPLFQGEPGWRTRRESTAYANLLNDASMDHLKIMLHQMLVIEEIPNVDEWASVLSGLALQIARDMTFTSLPHRQGQDMDVRRYIKIKKIPGGTPRDSEYVNGVVITKNVAHKQMSRSQKNPRIMLVTFPLEFSRVEGQYLHFGQIVRQEKEYLGNLASRITALFPHVILVEKSVSRLVLDALAAQNIVVARSVKPSAVQTVARMTQGDIFSSMDKLALEPHLGHCAKFRLQTFDHPLIPGRRKTYMRFEGCNKDMGCTIILRGGNIETLRRLKKVTRFLTFVVRNLKLETHLWRDLLLEVKLPWSPSSLHSPSTSQVRTIFQSDPEATPKEGGFLDLPDTNDDLPNEDTEQLRLTKKIDESLEPYTKTCITISSNLRFPPPYPIRRMKELDEQLLEAKRLWEDEVVRTEEKVQEQVQANHQQESTVTQSSIGSLSSSELPPEYESREDLIAQIEALPGPNLSSLPSFADGLPTTSTASDAVSYFSLATAPSSNPVTPNGTGAITPSSDLLFLPPTEAEPLKTANDIQLQSQYTFIRWLHEEHRRVWEWYLRKNKDDFVIEKYQCIYLREYTIPSAEGLWRPCFAPHIQYIKFYSENDLTLGQYIEKSVNDNIAQFLDPNAICTGKGCDRPLAQHSKVYLHNESKLTVNVERWDGPAIPPAMLGYRAQSSIVTWSVCRVCSFSTPLIGASLEMERYSFAKFLELHFYPTDVDLLHTAGCEHNIYRDHTRYFACRGLKVRFQSDPIILHEVVFPPSRIRVRPETQVDIKNADSEKLHSRNAQWYNGLIDDLRLISIEAATGDEEADNLLIADTNALIERAVAEREEISRLINQIYRETTPTDTLALNQVHAFRQDKIVAWQQDFDRLPKPRPPPTASNRASKASSAFDSVRFRWPRPEKPEYPAYSDVEEPPEKSHRGIEKYIPSNSDVSESESVGDMNEKTEKVDIPATEAEQAEVKLNDSEVESVEAKDTFSTDEQPKSDVDSDSTIAAVREPSVQEEGSQDAISLSQPTKRTSRLPRRTAQSANVAELIKKYQDFLPAQGVQDLAQTALAPRPLMSESEHEYPALEQWKSTTRTKPRHRPSVKKQPSTSDFEQGYAANVAPRPYSTTRRAATSTANRITSTKAFESHQSSRKASPEKRPARSNILDNQLSRPSSPTPNKHFGSRLGQPRMVSRSKDKAPGWRPPSSANNRGTYRRPTGTGASKVSTIAKQFERIGRDAERDKRKYQVISGRRARPVATGAKVTVLGSVQAAIADDTESSDSSEADDEDEGNEEDRQASAPLVPVIPDLKPPELVVAKPEPEVILAADPSSAEPADEGGVDPITEPTTEPDANDPQPPPNPIPLPPSQFSDPLKNKPEPLGPLTPSNLDDLIVPTTGLMKALSTLWPQPSRASIEFEDAVNDTHHIFRDSSMVVRLDEPTSIIALALNSPQYRDLLSKSKAEKRTVRETKLPEGSEAFMPDDRSVADTTSTWEVVDLADPSQSSGPADDLRVPSSKLPWAITFESGGLTISCTVLYPEQFDAFRRTYDCEKTIVESLSRCVKWNATGGKSGSAFLKTRDDRFIAKELSKPELQTMETFAPAYFDYMSAAIRANRPSLLAKVFGCYKLTFKKTGKDKGPGRAKSMQMNLLVMENLFYDRRFTRIYDLKGSTRNRHVQSTGRENEVLLDENLVETAHVKPLYMREHSKRILRGALYYDSKFLAGINVMDYSLVCGVDSQNNELVVGIVDYIRTYTWDKKLESWVKESAFLGGAGKGEPTIVTPKQYRQRFISAMERYFPLIPDRWMKQIDSFEEETSVSSEPRPDW